MSFFSKLGNKSSSKKCEEYCEDAKIFVQVHYVRERSDNKYSYNILNIKNDPERDECNEWYEKHNNPDNIQDIVELYMNESKLKPDIICKEYGLDPKIFTKRSLSMYPIEKWEAVALCFALDLNIAHARALLHSAGYCLSNSVETDLVIRYCIENDIYELHDINYILKKLYGKTLTEIM